MAERAAKKPNRSGRVPLRVQVEPELLERLKGVGSHPSLLSSKLPASNIPQASRAFLMAALASYFSAITNRIRQPTLTRVIARFASASPFSMAPILN
jgi:hypothetical protein